jgi:hypothetical protein
MKKKHPLTLVMIILLALQPACGGGGDRDEDGSDGADDGAPEGGEDTTPDADVPDDAPEAEGCDPRSCEVLGKDCGSWDDGCGTTVTCGPCDPGWGCTSEGSCVALPAAGAPVIFFSDLESGPKTGWDDGADRGAAVSIWGKNFGPERGTSFVSVGGVELQEAADYAEWGGRGPARGLERITFWVPSDCPDGPGDITVSVGGETSNPLPFTVRTGNLFLVMTDGDDDGGDGSWGAPWRTIVRAVEVLEPGDIAYVGDGVTQTEEDSYSACVNLSSSGEPDLPKAIVAVPGATVTVGNPSLQRAFHNWESGTGGYSQNWVVAKLHVEGSSNGIPGDSGFRIVGNVITAPTGDGQTGVIEGSGNHVRILGNEFHDVGDPDSSKLYHVVYISGVRTQDPPRPPTESDREIAWNHFHDNLANRAINIYSEQAESAYIERHSVHDNLIVNQRGDGILLGYYVTGENWIYNNVIVNAGLGPEWPDDASSHAGIRIDCGHENVASTTAHVYNNSLYGCGWSGSSWGSGGLLVSQEALDRSTTLLFMSNIIVSTGEPYETSDSAALTAGDRANLFYGSGAPPAWDTSALNADPLFVDPTVFDLHLQAGSPAIDGGSGEVTIVSSDFDGTTRPQGAACDIGAYEFIP